MEVDAKNKILTKLIVVTGNAVDYEFDGVISIELLQNMENHGPPTAKAGRALKPHGKPYVHIFEHAASSQDIEDGWNTCFLTVGAMSSASLFAFLSETISC